MFLTATGIVNEWPVSYHGTAKHNANSIAEQGYLLSKGERFHFGRDIYSTPDINVAAFYATRFSCEGVNYRMVIQNRVNPETFVRISPEKTLNGEYWISPNNEDVRPYGICFKKDLVKSKPLEQNKRQSSLINEFPSFGNTEDVSLEGSNQFENILREKSDSFLANYNNETFENFPTGENPSDLDLDLATTNYFDNTKELDDKEQSTEFANYKNISLEQEAIELPVEPASLVGGNTNPDLIEPYSEKQLILEALGEQNKGIALNKGVPIKKVFDGIFNRGNEEIQETPSRKRVTSTQFLTKLRHYAFLANEASCGTYGDAPFSDEIRGFFMVLVSNRQVIVSLARSKQLRTIQDWPFEDNALVAFEDSMNANVMIHGGIYQSYLLAQSQIVKNAQEIISQPDHQNFEIIVTGVGLGGAYAVLAALDIRQKVGTNPIKVYTYGQPRIGNTEFANYVDSLRSGLQIYRITYKKDYVPLYPDADSYLHTQEEYWISQRDDWIFQCSNVNGGENQECINSRRKNKEDTSPHNGPYFGTTMGKCAFSKL